MNKQLLTEQIQKVRALPPGENCEFTVEGAGVLEAFIASRANLDSVAPAEKALHDKIRKLLDHWKKSGAKPKTHEKDAGDERRTQLALRAAIDKILGDRWEEFTSDEAKLVRATYKTYAERGKTAKGGDRLAGLLQKVVAKLDATADAAEGTGIVFADEPEAIASRKKSERSVQHTLSAAEALTGGRHTPMSALEGIRCDLNVRKFEYEGEATIAGDIPGDVLVSVEKGGVTIDGFVSGNIIADGDITINGNVQGGLVVSRTGDIYVEQALMGSSIIAKKGSVKSKRFEATKIGFAWDTLTVDGPVLGGTISGGAIEIAERVNGALIRCAGRVHASVFEAGSRSKTVICLQRTLDTEVYDRPMSDEDTDRRREIRQLEEKIERSGETDRVMRSLVHNCYRTALFFLLGGARSAHTALDLQGIQLKALYLKQIIAIAEGASRFYDGVLSGNDPRETVEVNDFHTESKKSIELMRNDIEALPDEFGTAHRRYLLDRIREMQTLSRTLHLSYQDSDDLNYLGTTFARTVSGWRGVQAECERDADAMIARFGIEEDLLRQIQHETDSLEALLDETVQRNLRSEAPSDVQRAKSPLIRLLRESAERYIRSMEHTNSAAVKARGTCKTLRDALEEEGVVMYSNGVPGSCGVQAERYDQGVILTTSPSEHEGFDTNMASVIVLSESITGGTEFHLKGTMIQRQI